MRPTRPSRTSAFLARACYGSAAARWHCKTSTATARPPNVVLIPRAIPTSRKPQTRHRYAYHSGEAAQHGPARRRPDHDLRGLSRPARRLRVQAGRQAGPASSPSARIIAGHIFRRASYAGNRLEPADAAPLGASSRQADQLAYQAVVSGSYPWLWAPNLTPKPAPHGQHAG